jgi:HD superfamily phosphohydrolase
VNNTRTGLDVDKLDYFVRDSTCCGVGTVPEIGRFFDLARLVLQVTVHTTLCIFAYCIYWDVEQRALLLDLNAIRSTYRPTCMQMIYSCFTVCFAMI